jgi:TolB-like protein/DNA-binding SARP family transcriptional activator
MSVARLELKLLGGFQARVPDGPAVDIAAKKTQALLAYLALARGKAQSRDKLLGLLWSDRAQEQARNSLRQALTELGRALAVMERSPILKDHDMLAVEPGTVWVDALEFERLAAAGDGGDLQRSVALYEGDLLDGIAVRDPAFEEWLLVERQRLRNQAMATLKTLSRETGQAGAAAVHRLLALDPLQEAGHRALIRLHADAGEIGAALRQYETCRDLLKRELNVAPSTETEQLYREIRSRTVTLGGRGSPEEVSGSAAQQPHEAPPSKPSIAVLPFHNLGGDPEQRYFSDGITEDIITELSRFHQLIVIARHSSFQFSEQAGDLKRIGRELNAQYVVEGSIRTSGDRIRITAQLVEAASGSHLWAERYDRDIADLFKLQDEVARMIASALAVRLELEDLAKAKRKPPESMRAYDY